MLDYWVAASSVAINGQTAFVATESTGLYLVNTNDPILDGQLEGVSPDRVIIEGERAYLLENQALTITDLNANPNIIGTLDIEWGREFDVANNLAVIAQYGEDILIVDISDPEQLEIISSVEIDRNENDYPLDVTINDTFIFASYRRQGLFVISIENIREPEVIAVFDQFRSVNDVVIEGNLAILSTEGLGLVMMDISNIREPEEISTIGPDRNRRGYIKARIRDNLVYALGYYGSIDIINIQDIENPEIVQRFGIAPSTDFEIAGDRLIMTLDRYEGRWRSAVGIYVYSLEDPIRPEQTGRFLSIGLAANVVFKDDMVFLLEGIDWEQYEEEEDVYLAPKLNIINAADPMDLEYLSSYTVWDWDEDEFPLDNADVDMIGEHVYFAMGLYGLFVLNISDPQRPRLVRRLRTDCFSITVDETHAIISPAHEMQNSATNMLIIDITDPARPNEIAEIDTEDLVLNLIKTGDFVYVANFERGLTIINVADPENPEEISNLQGHILHTLKIQDGIVYSVVFYEENEADWGMWIVDVSDPANPQEITFFQLEGRPHRLDIQGNFAIVTCENPNSIWIMDISDPANPEITGTYFAKHYCGGVALNEEFAYIACSSHLKTFDCSGAMGILQPLQWVDAPELVIVNETDIVEFELVANAEDNDQITLEMDRRNLPDEAEFIDGGGGRGRFSWVTGFEDRGEYNPLFIATNEIDEINIEVEIRVLNVNRAPQLINQIPDLIHTEDGGRLEIALLDTIFHDPDEDELQFIILDAPESLNLNINRETTLFLNPEPDFNLPEGAEIELICQDGEGGEVIERFNVVIEPVNDAPAHFALIEPDPGTVIDGNEARFTWQETWDIESDSVSYSWNLYIGYNEIDTIFSIDMGSDTSVVISEIDTITTGLGISEQINAIWYAEASDGVLVTESLNRWEIILPYTQSIANQGVELPDHYSLGLNYPNPFNNSTTIPFSLPVSVPILLNVYDIYGRFQGSLINESFPAGCHQAIWNADSFPAGIYFYTIIAGEFSKTRKLVLVK